MKPEERIYCIEGHWNYGKREVEPSVEPILQMVAGMGQWTYARRDAATIEEMYYFLDREWVRCREGSILYIAAHGDPGRIWLSENQGEGLDALSAKVDCKNCMVHFGGCNVLDIETDRVARFMAESGATAVSGYATETGWTDTTWPPALALELMLFSSIKVEGIDLTDGRSASGRLPSLAEKLRESFPNCEFQLHTKWDKPLGGA